MRRRRSALLILAMLPLLLSGCLRGLVRNDGARTVAGAADGVWPVHVTSQRPHWLLRGSPGWVAAHEAGYGTLSEGEAAIAVHIILFADPESAAQGFERLAPEYLIRSFPNQIALRPWADPLRSDAVAAQAEAYSYFIAFAPNLPTPFPARLIKLRQGRVVALIAGIGLTDIQLAAGMNAIAYQADLLDGG